MQRPHEIVTSAQLAARPKPSRDISPAAADPATREPDPIALELTAVIWHAFASAFPSRWLPQVGTWSIDNHAVRTWASVLQGVSARQVRRALDALKARGEKWPPSAYEFRIMAVHDGVPSQTDAYDEAIAATRNWRGHAWTHPAVYAAAKAVGWYYLRTMSEVECRKRFQSVYSEILTRLRGGEQFVCPEPLRLPPPVEKPRTPAVAEAALAEIAAKLGAPAPSGNVLPECARCSGTGVAPFERKDGRIATGPCPDCFIAAAMADQ